MPQLVHERRVVLAVRSSRTRRRGIFPFGCRRQSFTFPLRVCFCREPRNKHDRSICNRAWFKVAAPEFKVIPICKQALDLGASPFRIYADEFEELAICHRKDIQEECFHRDFFRTSFCSKQWSVPAGWDEGHALIHPAIASARGQSQPTKSEQHEHQCGKSEHSTHLVVIRNWARQSE